jgi:Xaa-Pro aminopeptidase
MTIRHSHSFLSIAVLFLGIPASSAPAQERAHERTTPAYAERFANAYARLGKDLLIVSSSWAPAFATASRFDQNPNFFYFTGAESVLGGVLILDGAARRAELFLPTELPRGLKLVAPMQPAPGRTLPASLHVDGISEWSMFAPYIDRLLSADPMVTIRVDDGGFESGLMGRLGNPLDSLGTIANPYRSWQNTIHQRWPHATVRADYDVTTRARAVKEPAEIDKLRRAASSSVAAFIAGLARVSVGRHQRDVEGAVVESCMRLANGPSFWPWAMSGPNAAFPAPFAGAVDNRNLDRVMLAGELARLDVGCQIDHYMGDVGRTVPVAGTFDAGQREVVDLLVAAYRAGLAVVRDGALMSHLIGASVAEVARRRTTLSTALGRHAAAVITRQDGIPFWQVHGIGLEPAERLPDTLRAGMVFDYEPIFVVDGQGFYMEDMILVTASGYEILSKGLPSAATEIERAMRSGRGKSRQ